MLKFIFGLPCSGKSSVCFQKIKELSEQNVNTVLIVPEQFSFESEKEALHVLGDGFALKTLVLSFSRLTDEVFRINGGISARVLNDSDKVIFMNNALSIVADQLKLWGKYAHSITFAKTMIDTVNELKINAVSPRTLEKIAKLTDRQTLKNKLTDLKLIYENYNILIEEKFLDPSDKLNRLYDMLSHHKYFEGKTVFLDSFKGFTGQQFKILERIISQADDVYICLTNDTDNLNEYNIFSNIRTTVEKIKNVAKKYGVEIEEPLVLNNSFYNCDELKKVERLISGNEVKSENLCENITVCRADNVYDEAEFTARTIRKLVREENYRFRDFVIIARDIEKYTQAIDYACKKNEVSLFYDCLVPLYSLPFAKLCDFAIKAINFSSENIFGFLKICTSVLNTDEISTLENYVYLWNINGDIWLKDWDMNPRGFVTDEITFKDKENLEYINSLRKKAITPILQFKQNFEGNAYLMGKAIYDLFDTCDLKSVLKGISNSFEAEVDTFTKDVLKQGYDTFLSILDSLVVCFGEKSLTKNEYYEALSHAVSIETVGVIPQTLDQVTFGSADRIRPSRPKIAFILGANQGVFPKNCTNNGIFATAERKKLIELGLEISDNSIYSSIDENYLVYCNLCCATDKLFISYSSTDFVGNSLEPSAFVLQINEKINPKFVNEPLPISETNLPETKDSVFSEFCKRINKPNESAILKHALQEVDSKNRVETLIDNFTKKEKSISKENSQKLFGTDLFMSATRLDNYNSCNFSYFCKYGLKAKKLQPADFDVLQRGTIVHYVLESIISKYKETIKDMDKQELDLITEQYINEYLEKVEGFASIKNKRHEFIISKISRSLKEVVSRIADEFAQSEFKPVACEMKIGKDGIPLDFDYSKGKIHINGSIDRVDQYGGYVRIIDYKTGDKQFKLPDVLFGLNLQMLLYLYAITKQENSPKPAGILYMPSKRDLKDEGLAMNGFLLKDLDVVTAMEKENAGQFIPKLEITKSGEYSKKSSSFASDEEFELIFDYIEKFIVKTGESIANGDIKIFPIDGRDSKACKYCDFKSVCGIENDEIFNVPALKNDEVFEKMTEVKENGI